MKRFSITLEDGTILDGTQEGEDPVMPTTAQLAVRGLRERMSSAGRALGQMRMLAKGRDAKAERWVTVGEGDTAKHIPIIEGKLGGGKAPPPEIAAKISETAPRDRILGLLKKAGKDEKFVEAYMDAHEDTDPETWQGYMEKMGATKEEARKLHADVEKTRKVEKQQNAAKNWKDEERRGFRSKPTAEFNHEVRERDELGIVPHIDNHAKAQKAARILAGLASKFPEVKAILDAGFVKGIHVRTKKDRGEADYNPYHKTINVDPDGEVYPNVIVHELGHAAEHFQNPYEQGDTWDNWKVGGTGNGPSMYGLHSPSEAFAEAFVVHLNNEHMDEWRKHSPKQASAMDGVMRGLRERSRALEKGFDSSEPRDSDGRWVASQIQAWVKDSGAEASSLLKPIYREKVSAGAHPITGHCYAASEAVFHATGGQERSPWRPHVIRHEEGTHWFLKHRDTGEVLDPTSEQFETPVPYTSGRATGFLTRIPSKHAQAILRGIGRGDAIEGAREYAVKVPSAWLTRRSAEKGFDSSEPRDSDGRWTVGTLFSIPSPRDHSPVPMRVTEVTPDRIRVNYADRAEGGVSMPRESMRHFVDDLSGRVMGTPNSADPRVNAVLRGEGEYLGKGDDGLAFRVGDRVVKVSTTVPYQPMNNYHRSPGDAQQRMLEQSRVHNEMHRLGIPGVLPVETVVHGDKAFQIQPHLDTKTKLSVEQLQAVRDSVEAMHAAGYAVNDQIQVGLKDGIPHQYDLGKVGPLKDGRAGKWQVEDDISHLRMLAADNGRDPNEVLSKWAGTTQDQVDAQWWLLEEASDASLQDLEMRDTLMQEAGDARDANLYLVKRNGGNMLAVFKRYHALVKRIAG